AWRRPARRMADRARASGCGRAACCRRDRGCSAPWRVALPWCRRSLWRRTTWDRRSGAAGDRGHDRDLVTLFHGRVETAEKADVLTVHVDVDETADLAGVVADALLQAGVVAL